LIILEVVGFPLLICSNAKLSGFLANNTVELKNLPDRANKPLKEVDLFKPQRLDPRELLCKYYNSLSYPLRIP
jgi:hypothetical protein